MITNARRAGMHHFAVLVHVHLEISSCIPPCPVPCLRVRRTSCSKVVACWTSAMAAMAFALMLACALLMPWATASSKGCERAEQQCQAACTASGGVRSFSCAAKGTRYQCVCQVSRRDPVQELWP